MTPNAGRRLLAVRSRVKARVPPMVRDWRQAALERARQGDGQALGELLESFRPYLSVVARALRSGRWQAKVGDSDVLQDALLEAHRSFAAFRGATVEEFAGWLRQIVVGTTGHALRDLGAAKRDAAREQAVAGLSELIPADGSTPSGRVIRREQSVQIAEALCRLPEDMQLVILARHVDEIPYAELAEPLGRTEAAVRVLYTRALRRLRDECQGPNS